MGKPETDSPLSRLTWFTRPDRSEAEGRTVFNHLAQGNFLTGLDQPQFAVVAAELLYMEGGVSGLFVEQKGDDDRNRESSSSQTSGAV